MKTSILIFLVLVVGIFLLRLRVSYDYWEVKSIKKEPLSWADFQWVGDSISGKYVERTAMLIPCKVEGIANVVTLQFDLGSDLSGIYELNYRSFFQQNPTLKRKMRHPFLRKSKTYLQNLKIKFGNYTCTNTSAFVFADYGEYQDSFSKNDTIHLGTIGVDLFKNKVLIIDYPNQRFAIAETIPEAYKMVPCIDISLDSRGRALFPMKINNKQYNFLFDNGSSMFPLITSADRITDFSGEEYTDTVLVSSWGKNHTMTGKLIRDSFLLGGTTYNNVMIYADYRKIEHKEDWIGIAGNVLFWDKTLIIDYKNQRFGVKAGK